MDLFVHPPKGQRGHGPAPQRGPDYGPLIVVGGLAILACVIALILFVRSYLQAHPTVSNAIGTLLVALLFVVILGLIVAVAAVARWAWERAGTVKPDEYGIIPVPRKALRQSGLDLQTLPAVQKTAFARATRVIPEGVTTVSQSMLRDERPIEVVEPEPEIVKSKLFIDLLKDGVIVPGSVPYIGETPEETVRARWKEDLGSMVIVGQSGAGKTVAATTLGLQATMAGGRLMVGDPHAGDDDSLAAMLSPLPSRLRSVAQSPEEIADMLEHAVSIIDERYKPGNTERSPIFVTVDEITKLMLSKVARRIEAALMSIGVEGRKVNINAALFAQLGTIAKLGEVRDAATTTFVFRSRPDQARYAIGEKVNVDIRKYPDGCCYLMTRRVEYPRVQMPLVTRNDVAQVAAGLEGISAGQMPYTPAFREPSGSLPGAFRADVIDISGRQREGSGKANRALPSKYQYTSDEADRIMRMWKVDKLMPAQMVKEIKGIDSNGGRDYIGWRDAALEVIRDRERGAEDEGEA
jgi:hypothetical protein